MKPLIFCILLIVGSGCAHKYTKEEIDAAEVESNKRVEAMVRAGKNPYAEPQPQRDYASEGFLNGAGYLADKWSKDKGTQSQQSAPRCKQTPVVNQTTGQYDLVTQCQ